eukprot:COSAG05_NODE_3633_length_1945_cov_0.862947_3_plen_67_part_00
MRTLFPSLPSASLRTGCILVQTIPLQIAYAPAEVSTACDDLLEQLNEISFLGDMGCAHTPWQTLLV